MNISTDGVPSILLTYQRQLDSPNQPQAAFDTSDQVEISSEALKMSQLEPLENNTPPYNDPPGRP